MTRAVDRPAGSVGAWAKAPDFADDPHRRAEIASATDRDRAHYLCDGLREIECRACHACVMVKKISEFQTSVQWSGEARAQCSELTRVRDSGGNPAMTPTCSRLSASIDHGVIEGIIPPHG
ncbi:hypothetical protein ASG12_05965 [Williamsia sp. Leaf354]|uniref:hypothetical protein n=1 Tax=Williamsia sp. Leaf354 TaxID=1736349 RepID=UPI0006FC2485|nr:hypothetical protein [Williamsia sp. Leaf354]KQS00444.1 hypothetical protein ASG12_05965 [Williamsia sp. Leaf354]